MNNTLTLGFNSGGGSHHTYVRRLNSARNNDVLTGEEFIKTGGVTWTSKFNARIKRGISKYGLPMGCFEICEEGCKWYVVVDSDLHLTSVTKGQMINVLNNFDGYMDLVQGAYHKLDAAIKKVLDSSK